MPLQKSQGATNDQRMICGMASCETRDLQREIIFQKGIDPTPALESGFINWDHGKGPEDQIGVPTKLEVCRIEDHPIMSKSGLHGWGTWCEGMLFKGHYRADQVWNLVNALDTGGYDRRLAWSVQGRAIERDNLHNVVTKSQMYHMALTHQPVQTDSFAQVLKSLSGGEAVSKSMDTSNAAPLRLENLDTGMTSVLFKSLYGDCPRQHFDRRGLFKSKRAMLAHLAECRGYGVKPSAAVMKALLRSMLR